MIIPGWQAPSHIHCASTLRVGGVSQAPYHALNLGTHVGDYSEDVAVNRQRLKEALNLPSDPLWLNQIHSHTVLDLDGTIDSVDADAVMSRQVGVVCTVMTADCLPVLFTNRKGTAIAATHAGWRGLCDGILEQTVTAMQRESDDEILAWLGPAIGALEFEVGAEVRQQFIDQQSQTESCFIASKNTGKWLADIYQLARTRLATVGVTQVTGGDRCTYTESESFYSYRREGITGRMASLIWMTN